MGMKRIFEDQRGASMVLVALSMVALLGMAALAIDVGMLYTAKGQAQNAADSGALAGAGALLLAPEDADAATVQAEAFAEKHEIIQQTVQIDPAADVQVDLNALTVTVTARRINTRGNAVPTFFAAILGSTLVDIEATAVAAVFDADAAACLKPWAVPDAFDDINANGIFDPGVDYYESGVTSWGQPYRGPDADFGTQLTLKVSSPGDAITPGQFFPIDLPLPSGGPTTGGDKYRENITSCNGQIVEVGGLVQTENGNMIGPTKQGVGALIDEDPNAFWDDTHGVMNSAFPPGASPRIARVPFFDPGDPPGSGKQDLTITNIAGIFIEGVGPQGDVTGRIMQVSGTGEGGLGLLKTVRLVQ